MKITLFSTGRADRGALTAVNNELIQMGVDSHIYTIASTPYFDTEVSVANASARVITDTVNAIASNHTDLAVILGDRFEALAAAQAAYLMKLPIAHLSGGDLTEGSQDDSMRHAITKLAHLHFVTNDDSARRVEQMGEESWRIYVVGYPGMDNLHVPLTPSQEILFQSIRPVGDYILVVWHPNTLGDTVRETNELVEALKPLGMPLVLVGPNQDVGHEHIHRSFEQLCAEKQRVGYWGSLPRPVYLRLLRECTALVGNSSSAYYEAPSFGTRSIDVGDRQQGRIGHSLLVRCEANQREISEGIMRGLGLSSDELPYNPYQGRLGSPSFAIAQTLAGIKPDDKPSILRKKWHAVQHRMGQNPQGTGMGALSVRDNGEMGSASFSSSIQFVFEF